MSEKVSPATKKVARADGLKQPSANTTLTTPSQEGFTVGKIAGPGAGSKDKLFT